jgi:hypothetical protein
VLRSLVSLSLILLASAVSAQDACRRGYAVAQQLVTKTTGGQFALGDFNGDGRMDLVNYGRELNVLLNRGGDVFEPSWQGTISNPADIGQVSVADVTGDGQLDVIMRATWTVAVAPGRGDGTFAPFVETRNLPVNSQWLLVDLDGDRLPELVDVDGVGLVIHTPQRDGSFRLAATVPLAAKWDWDLSLPVAGDFDGDGRIDLMSVSTRDFAFLHTHTLWNDGNWTFSSGRTDLYYVRLEGASFAPAELDGDTATEVVVLHGGQLHILETNGRQLTYRTKTIAGAALDRPERLIGAGDLDRDGAPDVLFGRGGRMSVLWGPRDGEAPYDRTTLDFAADTLADVNGDGTVDILSTGWESLGVIYGAAGSRELQAAPIVPHPGTPAGLIEADFDRDGQMDLAEENSEDPYTILLRREGSTFTEKARIRDHRVRAVADLDGDGHLDLVTRLGVGGTHYYVHFGTGDFAFAAPLEVSDKALFEGVAARTAGGNVLIFTGSDGAIQSVSLENRSAAAVPVTTVDVTDSVAIADVDGDGDSDLVAGSTNAYRMVIQDAGGWTSHAVELPVDMRFDSAVTGDLDRDGRVDLLLLEITGAYTPLLAQGDGTYVRAARPAVAASLLTSLRLTDFDHDGLLDVVLTGRPAYGTSGQVVMVHRNTGSAFEAYGVFPVGAVDGGAAVIEDFDRDGWDDLLFAHPGGTVILRNVCTPARVRATVTPAKAFEGQPITLTINAEPTLIYGVGQVVVRRNGAVIHVEQPNLGNQFASLTFTLPPLPAGTHAFEVEYQDYFAGTTSTTVTVTVDARGNRRRAVRSR